MGPESDLKHELYEDKRRADVCQRYYDLYYGAERIYPHISRFVESPLVDNVLFIGGLTNLAARIAKEKKLVFADYSENIVMGANSRFNDLIPCYQADIRQLPEFGQKFDLIVVLGRVSAYLCGKHDLHDALTSVKSRLNKGGALLMDFFRADKMLRGEVFNNQHHHLRGEDFMIDRSSFSEIAPNDEGKTLINWRAEYLQIGEGDSFHFVDSQILRGFSVEEIESVLRGAEFTDWSFSAAFEDDSIMVRAS